MSIRNVLDADQRLVLLRSLDDCGGDANESVLQDCLGLYGHNVSRDAVRTHMAWLSEQGLVQVEDLAGCHVATLTGRGDDVLNGRATVPGVKKGRRK
jgi:repressor of nif and glnA expression